MQILAEDKIREYLSDKRKCVSIYVYDTIDSTNDEAKRQWKEQRKAPCLFVSAGQTNGRGRRGRSFYSPYGTGIYMSLLIEPQNGLEEAVHITTATAVIVAKVLRKYSGEDIGIKWVNDLYLNDKKICGILTEAIVEPEINKTFPVIVGIGINLDTQVFPDELQGIAGSLGKAGTDVNVNAIVADICNDVLEFSENMKDCAYVDDYRKMSIVLGKEIRYNEGNAQITARALDIDSEGGLMVEHADGSVKVLKTGEITVRIAE